MRSYLSGCFSEPVGQRTRSEPNRFGDGLLVVDEPSLAAIETETLAHLGQSDPDGVTEGIRLREALGQSCKELQILLVPATQADVLDSRDPERRLTSLIPFDGFHHLRDPQG